MGIAKEGFSDTVCVCFFVNKENSTNMVGDLTAAMRVAVARAITAKFTFSFEIAGLFIHELLPVQTATKES